MERRAGAESCDTNGIIAILLPIIIMGYWKKEANTMTIRVRIMARTNDKHKIDENHK